MPEPRAPSQQVGECGANLNRLRRPRDDLLAHIMREIELYEARAERAEQCSDAALCKRGRAEAQTAERAARRLGRRRVGAERARERARALLPELVL